MNDEPSRSIPPGAALVLAALLAVGSQASAAEPFADLVVRGARVWSGRASGVDASAVAVRGDRLLAVGNDAEVDAFVGASTRVLDAGGRLLVPGFIDGHTHFVDGGEELLGADLRDATSPGEFARRFGEFAAGVPAGRWITAATWDHEAWPGAPLPRREWIDPVSGDHPVFVQRLDGHMGLANSRALALAGVTAETPDPEGGAIVRDPATGEPTGVLKDAAMGLVFAVMPPKSDDELADILRAATLRAASLGVTTVHDITSWSQWPAMRALHERGELLTRIYARTPIAEWERQRDWIAAHGPGDAWLRLGGLKAFVDGSLGSTTALFFEPYADAPETRGFHLDDGDPAGALGRRAIAADAAGLQLSIHAIGDRANAETLDLAARLAAVNGPRDRRLRIEHAQHLRREDVPRFAELGVFASMQPFHAADDGRWADKRLGARARQSYVFRSLLDAGARVGFGSDWTVGTLDPIQGIAAAVTRRTLDGRHPDGWYPEEKITVEQALRAYTAANAWAEFAEDEKGTLAPGRLADFVLLSDDLFRIAPERIETVRVDLTVVGGRIVFERDTP